MGLEIVEIVLDVERTFGIKIDDDELAETRSVGELYQLVLRHVETGRELQSVHPGCPSMAPFLALRKSLCSLLPMQRNRIRPRMELETIIPRSQRRAMWERLQSLTKITLPPLILPDLFRLCLIVLTVIFFSLMAFVLVGEAGLPGFFVSLSAAIILWYGLLFLSLPFALEFPPECQTISDAVRFAKPPHYPPQQEKLISTDPDEIWRKLVSIIVETLNVKESEVTPATDFIKDLKAG